MYSRTTLFGAETETDPITWSATAIEKTPEPPADSGKRQASRVIVFTASGPPFHQPFSQSDPSSWVPLKLPGEPDVLYRNNGNGTFTDVTKRAGIKDPGYYGFGVLFADLDDDGWPDIYVANDSMPNLLFHNNHDGTFTEQALKAGVALSGNGKAQAGMGVDAADDDGDGRLDLIVTNFSDDYNTLYENNGAGFFTDVSHLAGIAQGGAPYMGWGTGFVDFDNDGHVDLFFANGHVYPDIDGHGLGTTYLQRKQLFRNLGNRRFLNVTDEVGGGLLPKKSSRGVAFGDYDNDGDIDAVVVNLNDRPTLLRNDTPPGNHWITLRLRGAKSNRDGIGARIAIEAGGGVRRRRYEATAATCHTTTRALTSVLARRTAYAR